MDKAASPLPPSTVTDSTLFLTVPSFALDCSSKPGLVLLHIALTHYGCRKPLALALLWGLACEHPLWKGTEFERLLPPVSF